MVVGNSSSCGSSSSFSSFLRCLPSLLSSYQPRKCVSPPSFLPTRPRLERTDVSQYPLRGTCECAVREDRWKGRLLARPASPELTGASQSLLRIHSHEESEEERSSPAVPSLQDVAFSLTFTSIPSSLREDLGGRPGTTS